jgi:2-iminobutanoate/2-iminopropanoate deaminase
LSGDSSAQAEQATTNVEAMLGRANMTTANLVKLTYLLTRHEDSLALVELRQRRWASGNPPAVTAYVVPSLAHPNYLIEIEAVTVEA